MSDPELRPPAAHRRADEPRRRGDFRAAAGVLLVLREVPSSSVDPGSGQPPAVLADPSEGPEILIAVWDDGSVTGLHCHVDLGAGLRTALAQLVAEELDVEVDRVALLMGSTGAAPNQGATIASASIQVHAAPLRQAAAQARDWLLVEAAARLGLGVDALVTVSGGFARRDSPAEAARVAPSGGFARRDAPAERITWATLLADRHVELMLTDAARLKPASEHRIVGTSTMRIDIPAKATGAEVFVHDKRLPGMLHGRVGRPPYAGLDAGDFVGNSLESVDEGSVAHIPGIRAVVVIRDFVGIVAEREEAADAAMRALRVAWRPLPGSPPLADLESALKSNPSTRRVLLERGDVDAALAGAAEPMSRSYVWPYQLHASIGPSCAVADWQGGALTVWAGTQNPHLLRADLALLTGLPVTAVDVVRMEAAGCYGRNCADDVAADAALLSRAVGAPVRVQLSREQEHLWEPKGAAQLMQVQGGLTADGQVAGYDFQTAYPSNGAPTLALLLTRTVLPAAIAYEMGDRTAVPPYDYANLRVVAHDMAPILRAAWLRGVSALPNVFAHESYIDELATAAAVDPVEFRLRQLPDERAAELVRATAERAGWLPHTEPQQQAADGRRLKGQGFAYARYLHSRFPGFGAAWAAWVADVEVDRETGEVHVGRVFVGHDAGMMVNPAGVRHQVHGNVLQTTSRALKESVRIDAATRLPASREWGGYPILEFREVPVVEVLMMPRQEEPPLGAGESSSVPGTAAIANAIFDATGVRFRQPPFTPEVVRAALNPLPAQTSGPSPTSTLAPAVTTRSERDAARTPPGAPVAAHWPRRRSLLARAAGLVAGVVALGLAAVGWRPAIAPMAAGSATGVYTEATLARGRQLAAMGNCSGCHTAPGGLSNAGGLALATPFGVVYSTNLTPDAATGIGRWSFSAFQRAMREGISRDGTHLYPAFPYTAFTRTTDDDLTALYAWLMAQPPVAAVVPKTALAFPFNLRPLMALWNALFLQPGPASPVAGRSPLWSRGAYLVDGLGHCGACHSARSALGAEQVGTGYLAGALADGWEAPPLTALSRAPLPWTEAELFAYLRQGHSAQHGPAGGPMASVIRQLQAVPEADIRAMAHYLASFQTDPARVAPPLAGPGRGAEGIQLPGPTQRLFEAACGACHHDGNGPQVFGRNTPLALNTNLHSDRPDNLLRTLLDGIQQPATAEVGPMPAFRHALDDAQVAELAAYLRQRFAPDKPPWPDLRATTRRLRDGAIGH